MWVDYRGPLSTVYNDGEVSTCGEISAVYDHVFTKCAASESMATKLPMIAQLILSKYSVIRPQGGK